MKDSVYPAKYDWWLWPILALSSVGLLVWGILVWEQNPGEGMILIGAGLFDAALFAVILFPCRYTIGDEVLEIRCGLIRQSVPVAGIRSVRPTSNPLSAPAPSLRRVEIRLADGRMFLVSPRDREGFIRELLERAGLGRPAD